MARWTEIQFREPIDIRNNTVKSLDLVAEDIEITDTVVLLDAQNGDSYLLPLDLIASLFQGPEQP